MRLRNRIPEPEVMDDSDQACAYSEADFALPHDMFVDLCREKLGADLSGRVLDLGCGPADVTARFAQAFTDTEIVGVDASGPMLELGRERVENLGLQRRIELRRVMLPVDDTVWAADEPYDCVISNSLLHHLHDPSVLWRTVTGAARPGAAVFVMDLVRPDTTEEADRLVRLYAAGEPEVLRADFRNSLCAAFTDDEVRAQLRAVGLDVNVKVAVVSDRHVVAWGRSPGREPQARGF